MNFKTIIGDNIRGFRNKRKWTQARLGEESGLNGSYIGEVERGEKNITAIKLCDIARVLKIKPFLFFIERAYQKSPEEIRKALTP
jgi:transcriptional regulator with XRE-family HTH domain